MTTALRSVALIIFVTCFMMFFLSTTIANAAPTCPSGKTIWWDPSNLPMENRPSDKLVAAGCIFDRLPAAKAGCSGLELSPFSTEGCHLCVESEYVKAIESESWEEFSVGPEKVDAESVFACLDLPNGCEGRIGGIVAWWPFDESSGVNSQDLVARNDGKHLNGPVPTVDKENMALTFDGIDDYVEVDHAARLNFGTGDFSVEGWIRTDQKKGTHEILGKRAPGGESRRKSLLGYQVLIHEGKLGLQLTTENSSSYISEALVADGEWHHFAITVDRDEAQGVRWFLDGAEVAPRHNPKDRSGSLNNTSPLRFGVNSPPESPRFFAGSLDEITLYRRALAADEMHSIYFAGRGGRCKAANTNTGVISCEKVDIKPNQASVTEPVALSGSFTGDPLCDSYDFEWFDDGTGIPGSNNNPMTYIGFDQGVHKVCFKVTDDCEKTCTACEYLTIVAPGFLEEIFCDKTGAWWTDPVRSWSVQVTDERSSQRVRIDGSDGNDLILGNDLANRIYGHGGNDCIYGFGGADVIHGDKVWVSAYIIREEDSGHDTIYGGKGNDRIWGDAKSDVIYGEGGDDEIHGDAHADTLYGGAGKDTIYGDQGNDTIYGGDDRDKLKGDSGWDTIYGGAGDDFCKGDSGRDQLFGGPGDDRLCGNSGGDALEGQAGKDDCRQGSGSGLTKTCEFKSTRSQCTTTAWRAWF